MSRVARWKGAMMFLSTSDVCGMLRMSTERYWGGRERAKRQISENERTTAGLVEQAANERVGRKDVSGKILRTSKREWLVRTDYSFRRHYDEQRRKVGRLCTDGVKKRRAVWGGKGVMFRSPKLVAGLSG
jgi:hypothetical protein